MKITKLRIQFKIPIRSATKLNFSISLQGDMSSSCDNRGFRRSHDGGGFGIRQLRFGKGISEKSDAEKRQTQLRRNRLDGSDSENIESLPANANL